MGVCHGWSLATRRSIGPVMGFIALLLTTAFLVTYPVATATPSPVVAINPAVAPEAPCFCEPNATTFVEPGCACTVGFGPVFSGDGGCSPEPTCAAVGQGCTASVDVTFSPGPVGPPNPACTGMAHVTCEAVCRGECTSKAICPAGPGVGAGALKLTCSQCGP